MARIAFMTFGVLYEPRAHSRSKGFIDRIPAVYEVAERSEGFIGRSCLDSGTGLHSWGELVCPSFLSDELHPNVARTLTLWRSLESVFAFAYAGLGYTPMALTRTLSISGVRSIRPVTPGSWTAHLPKRSLPEMPKRGRVPVR